MTREQLGFAVLMAGSIIVILAVWKLHDESADRDLWKEVGLGGIVVQMAGYAFGNDWPGLILYLVITVGYATWRLWRRHRRQS